MSKLAQMQAMANEAIETYDDMNEATKGGGGIRLLPVGACLARFVEYVEYGQQPQEFEGKAKAPALEARLGFALYGPGYENEDGTPYIIRPFEMALSRNEKAQAYLAFKAMNYKGLAKHFAQLLGEAYLLDIVTHKGKGANAKERSVIDMKKIRPPIEPLSKQPYPVPPARDEDLKLFLWHKPDLAAWNDLKIDGQNDDGKSKNFIQERILSAVDFSGSPLETLLMANNVAFTVPAKPAKAAAPAVPGPALPNVPAAPVAPAGAPVMAASPAIAPSAPAIPTASAIASVPTAPAVPSVAAPVVPAAPAMPAMPVIPAAPAVPA